MEVENFQIKNPHWVAVYAFFNQSLISQMIHGKDIFINHGSYVFANTCRALTPLFGNRAHGIGKISGVLTKIGKFDIVLMSRPPISASFSKKSRTYKGRRRPFREAGSGHKQWNTVSCVDTFSIISKFSAQNSKI